MPTEEQTISSNWIAYFSGGANWDRVGQRLTITNRIVSKLSFKTVRVGACAGATLTLTIRKVSDDSLIVSKSYGNVASVPLTEGWIEVTFDTPALVNQEVRILMEWGGTLGDGSNYLKFLGSPTSVKAGEYVTRYYAAGNGYTGYDVTDKDAAYIYTYTAGAAPTVTTQAVTAIAPTTATGNGNITALGDTAVTQHGHCWNTTGTPTTVDSKTTNGAGVVGAFTSSITGLTAGTIYYVRAYATNTTGTSYGNQVSFTAGTPTTMIGGNIAVVQTRLHYIGTGGIEYWIQGVPL